MKFRLRFTSSTLTRLRTLLKTAYDRGDARLVRRISALLAYAQGQEVTAITADLSVSPETIYLWLRAFLVERFESLGYRAAPGRPANLTKTQKGRLKTLINAGPLAYGFTSGGWSSLLIQELILHEFGVLYHRHYICELLKNLGYSYHSKAIGLPQTRCSMAGFQREPRTAGSQNHRFSFVGFCACKLFLNK